MIRWPKATGLALRRLAARLQTTPAKLFSEALQDRLQLLEQLATEDPPERPETPQRRTAATARRTKYSSSHRRSRR